MMRLLLIAGLATLSACQTMSEQDAPADRFFATLSSLCGKAYEGRLVSSDSQDENIRGQRLVMHVRECSADAIRIPFLVGEDRSRTWIVTRTGTGLRLKHDHRHEDGSEDKLSRYGGDTLAPGSAERQEFPADDFSKQLFREQGLLPSIENVWAMEVDPGRHFAYELRRPQRFFRAEFDLSRPVAPPR